MYLFFEALELGPGSSFVLVAVTTFRVPYRHHSQQPVKRKFELFRTRILEQIGLIEDLVSCWFRLCTEQSNGRNLEQAAELGSGAGVTNLENETQKGLTVIRR